METIALSQKALDKAITALRDGDVIIFPTDTVYGFLADASNKKAVDKIYKIKKRPKSKPLSVFVKDLKMAESLVKVDERQAKILKKFWPGQYTFILKRKKTSLTNPTAVGFVRLYGLNKKTIAIRIPKHTFLQKLLKKVNRPLAQTSVNISGELPLINIGDIIEKFGSDKNILIISAGDLKKSKPSKITDLTNNTIKTLRK
ncbi:MAG: threonylcarbamoyl-AMP synthase [Candidatus Staskawiczbacteria bacterium RIFCSPLOWO2_01_FULL_40_39]|uniref:L-threonylcarbamoyladenylate synthase n=1 Tax=Candidatus Staskawiczbacteria bacterium RIFCSPHIGHO2_01_FULL_39_25 TaxID=1802202 RepID=A0A1G2HPC5_9BACT|nr:MAG: threonylcarbamoyl-AMP synthase [Candidatus Staskawiczbacteria bacterium RIFCSPHIGHO2_01_FULL_39_25]OGZ73916.1 MAG: threonylcarbamoyl-AMP synthase [Candidatus Staskawiczbacteria bacterium RIFCSPLOWO2_01_FULL_40_39]